MARSSTSPPSRPPVYGSMNGNASSSFFLFSSHIISLILAPAAFQLRGPRSDVDHTQWLKGHSDGSLLPPVHLVISINQLSISIKLVPQACICHSHVFPLAIITNNGQNQFTNHEATLVSTICVRTGTCTFSPFEAVGGIRATGLDTGPPGRDRSEHRLPDIKYSKSRENGYMHSYIMRRRPWSTFSLSSQLHNINVSTYLLFINLSGSGYRMSSTSVP